MNDVGEHVGNDLGRHTFVGLGRVGGDSPRSCDGGGTAWLAACGPSEFSSGLWEDAAVADERARRTMAAGAAAWAARVSVVEIPSQAGSGRSDRLQRWAAPGDCAPWGATSGGCRRCVLSLGVRLDE